MRSRPRYPLAGRPSASQRAAFTLVELLVVVAILALLISILTPSLQRARKTARGAVCGGSLRQVGNAFTNAIEDNRGRFLTYYWNYTEGWSLYWTEQLKPYFGSFDLIRFPGLRTRARQHAAADRRPERPGRLRPQAPRVTRPAKLVRQEKLPAPAGPRRWGLCLGSWPVSGETGLEGPGWGYTNLSPAGNVVSRTRGSGAGRRNVHVPPTLAAVGRRDVLGGTCGGQAAAACPRFVGPQWGQTYAARDDVRGS